MFPLAQTAPGGLLGGIAGATPYGAAANFAGSALKSIVGDDASSSAKSGDARSTANFGGASAVFGDFSPGRSASAPAGAATPGGLPPWLIPALAGLSLGLTLGYMLGKR